MARFIVDIHKPDACVLDFMGTIVHAGIVERVLAPFTKSYLRKYCQEELARNEYNFKTIIRRMKVEADSDRKLPQIIDDWHSNHNTSLDSIEYLIYHCVVNHVTSHHYIQRFKVSLEE